MKSFILILTILIIGSFVKAESFNNGAEDLLVAITICPSPNNPLVDGLQQMGGNEFGEVVSAVDTPTPGLTTIHAEALSNPAVLNGAIKAPVHYLGQVTVIFGYILQEPSRPLKCEVSIQKH